jgi:hypothetical protein
MFTLALSTQFGATITSLRVVRTTGRLFYAFCPSLLLHSSFLFFPKRARRAILILRLIVRLCCAAPLVQELIWEHPPRVSSASLERNLKKNSGM